MYINNDCDEGSEILKVRKIKATMNGLESRLISPWKKDFCGVYGGLENGVRLCNKRCESVCN